MLECNVMPAANEICYLHVNVSDKSSWKHHVIHIVFFSYRPLSSSIHTPFDWWQHNNIIDRYLSIHKCQWIRTCACKPSNEYEWMFMCLLRNMRCTIFVFFFLPISKVNCSMQDRFTLNSMSLSRELCINVYNLKHLCVKQLFIRCGRQQEPLCHSGLRSMHMWW